MTCRISKRYLLVFIIFIAFCCKQKTLEAARMMQNPNLLFIFADQYRQASLGFLKEDPVHTPNLDQLAKEGFFLVKL